MRRRDLETGIAVQPGLYLIDGPPGDPMGHVVAGPFLDTDAGRQAAELVAAGLAKRWRRAVTLTRVIGG